MGRGALTVGTLILYLAMVVETSAITAFETTVAEIIQNPDKFNQMEVTVPGKAIQIEQKFSQMGSPYTTFFLVDPGSGAKILVEYRRGILDLTDSTLVTVHGNFYKKPTRAGFTPVIRAVLVQQ